MSVSSTSPTLFSGQMTSAMRLLVLTLLFALHFIFVACDSGSVKEEEDSLQTTQTAQPNDPVVVGTTDDQTPPTVSLDNSSGNSGSEPRAFRITPPNLAGCAQAKQMTGV